jgi:hypothetical protein
VPGATLTGLPDAPPAGADSGGFPVRGGGNEGSGFPLRGQQPRDGSDVSGFPLRGRGDDSSEISGFPLRGRGDDSSRDGAGPGLLQTEFSCVSTSFFTLYLCSMQYEDIGNPLLLLY